MAGTLSELLLLCSSLADTTPLLFLMRRAQERNLSIGPEFGEIFLQMATPALQKLLQLPAMEKAVEAAWNKATVDQLVSFALLDRYLRRRAGELWRRGLDRVAQIAEQKMERSEEPDESLILRLEGRQQKRLQVLFPEGWSKWSRAWADSTRRAINHLAARPRGVSLANAEKLLSQQVYTDQGHFLLELLQNADDARANEFEVIFEKHAITVIHNGFPFDFRDLVGVLSIGQTTKTERQIGYFGVGFKSVFEVTERPRIASGHFAFEIVDISIPRLLKAEVDPLGRTVLVLPLREGLSVEPYYQRALEIERTLLLNLPNVSTLRWTGPDGTRTVLGESRDGNVYSLSRDEHQTDYLVWNGTYNHEGDRPEGKPKSANVMLAFPLDGETDPPDQNLFSFLPIQENSGLRFLVGSHFDVPVDRERLDRNSDWNRGIVNLIPELIARACREEPSRVLELLTKLPLPGDPVGPMFLDISPALVEQLRRVRFIGTSEGEWLLPFRAELLEPELAPFFTGAEKARFLEPADQRTREWLSELGARSYDLKTLLLDLAQKKIPGQLKTPDLRVWSDFHKLLLHSPSFDAWEKKLRAVPLFLDDRAELAAALELHILPEEWDGIFEESPRTLYPGMLEIPETETLAASLRIRELRWEDLLHHLRRRGLTRIRFEPLVTKLTEAPKAIQLSFLQLPLFTDQLGETTALAGPFEYSPGALVGEVDTPHTLFPELRFCRESQALLPLLEAYNWPVFNRSRALKYLLESGWKPSVEQARLFRHWMMNTQSEWATIEDLELLSRLPIFESSEGTLRPLKELWNYEEDEVSALLPDLPQLKPQSSSEKLVEHFGLQHLLGQAGLETLIERFEQSDSLQVLELLGSRAEVLSRRQIGQLLARPLVGGRRVCLADEHRGLPGYVEVAEPDFVILFQALELDVADLGITTRLAPLLQTAAYPLLGLSRLVEVLRVKKPPVSILPELHKVLLTRSMELCLGYSLTLLQSLPIWECIDGQVRATDQLPPTTELSQLLMLANHQLKEGYPVELEEIFPRLEPLEFLVGFVRDRAKPNRSLLEQPEWFNSVKRVDAVSARLTKYVLCVDTRDTVRDERLYYLPVEAHAWMRHSSIGDNLLHPESDEGQIHQAYTVEPCDILSCYELHMSEEGVRQAFYDYLLNQLGAVVRDEAAREFLISRPIWRSSGDARRCLDELVLEPDLPDLGFDWYPHSEIPEELLEQLRNTLGVGRPDPETLFRTLLPAYFQALEQRQDTDGVLKLMARVSEPLSGGELREIFVSWCPEGEFEIAQGSQVVALSQVYCPPAGLAPLSCLPYQKGEYLGLLRKLGMPYLPPVDSLRAIPELALDDARALAAMVEWVWEERNADLLQHLNFLSGWRWVEDRRGDLRAPVQLYVPKDEVEELIGTAPSLYPAAAFPVSLMRAIGIRDEENIEMAQVLSFLRAQVKRGERVSGRFYHFLEEGIERGVVSEAFLRSSFQDLDWVWTDEAEYRNHSQVLGFPAYRYFGTYRGTWEQVHQRFPNLARGFQIPGQLSSTAVLSFLREVAQGRHPDCPHRLLVNCLALLADYEAELPRDWAVLPARRLPDLETCLVSADKRGVVRSNSPTLAALFGQGGTLWVVESDDPEHGELLNEYYDLLGIPRLRDAYTVEPDPGGSDVTEGCGELVAGFRTLLGAVYSVLPRLRSARPEWLEGDWLAESHLKPFTTAGPIRVIEGLKLLYELPGVSRVRVQTAVAYDPDTRRLYVSAGAVHNPMRHAVELAEGLSDCIYQGPGSENLVDLLNLLLLFRDAEQMNAYLDQRHFPRPFEEREQGTEAWRKRLGEILDYGLHHALERRFPELAGAAWERWRDLSWKPEIADSRAFLSRLEIENPSTALLDAFDEMMESAQVRLPSVEMAAVQVVQASEQSQPSTEVSQEDGTGRPSVFSNFRNRLAKKLTNLISGSGGVREPHVGMNPVGVDLVDTYQHPPERHMLYSDTTLQGHSRYCLEMLLSNFDSKNQLYVVGYEGFQPIFLPSGRTVQFSGALTSPMTPLPMPVYSRLIDIETEGGESRLEGPDHLGLYRLVPPDESVTLHYTVEVSEEPEFRDLVRLDEVDPRLVATTVSLDKLPADIRKWIDWARGSGLPHWQLADRANEFIRASYQYDLNYMKSEKVAKIMGEPVRAGENRLLDILHAGASGRYLGTGVCTELSAILLEMLRHSDIPCSIAAVWMLDEGLIHVPDHVIVMVLVPSEQGPYWLPLDPSGQRIVRTSRGSEQTLTRLDLLEKAAELLLPGMEGIPGSADRRQRFLQDRLLGILGHSDLLELFLKCLANPEQLYKELEPELLELQHRGFIEIDHTMVYQVFLPERESWG